MKQIAQYQDGRLELQDVPVPEPTPGGVLVRVQHSVISAGTERMKVEQAKMNLIQKARARPDQVRKVLDTARTLGWKSALEKVKNRLESPTPLGYSAAGVVERVDPLNTRFRVGDLVACAGAECAFHAEWIAVPDLLAARIPEGVPTWKAAYATIASIALHAIRQSDARVGERALVIGQGLVGALVVNLLAAAGIRACAVDLLDERRNAALALGAELFCNPKQQKLESLLAEWNGGIGVDHAFLCTASSSNAPFEQAMRALRDRGRIVVVGNSRVELDWKEAYAKEIEVRYSRSYGPGRYDPSYEWGGTDYPVAYVPWTETRNLDACLHLMKTGGLAVEHLTTGRVPFDEAPRIYQELLDAPGSHLGVVLDYADAESPTVPACAEEAVEKLARELPAAAHIARPVRSISVIGAGNFARTMLLPHLKGKIPFDRVVNQTPLSTRHVQKKFGFADIAANAAEVLDSAKGEGLLIAARHNLHAELVKQGLSGGVHVFVEKPLCLTEQELDEIEELALNHSESSVQVGFNRRFAPAAVALKRRLQSCAGPKSVRYTVHAGPLRPDHWYANYEESGGRIVGEACHFLDFFRWLLDEEAVAITGELLGEVRSQPAFPDSIAAQVVFDRGSVANLVYSDSGDSTHPKEICDLTASGLVASITDFQRMRIWENREQTEGKFHSKGHAEEMAAWLVFLRGEAEHPLPLSEAIPSMRLTFAVLESIRRRERITLSRCLI